MNVALVLTDYTFVAQPPVNEGLEKHPSVSGEDEVGSGRVYQKISPSQYPPTEYLGISRGEGPRSSQKAHAGFGTAVLIEEREREELPLLNRESRGRFEIETPYLTSFRDGQDPDALAIVASTQL
jgi:hypothetical protein